MYRKVFEIGSEYDWDSNIPFLKENENEFWANICKQNVKFLRSGRDAIRYVARVCKDQCRTVLMPALICSCVPEQFIEENYHVIYYKVNSDFTADLNDIEEKILPNSIFFFMNYFGEQFISKEAIQNLKNKYKNIICVEDITHDFLKRQKEQFQNDFTVCSIRKWFAIPDGGMVIGKEPLCAIEIEKNSYFAELRVQAMKQKNVYLNSGILTEKEQYRTTLAISNNFIDSIDHIADIQNESMKILSQIDMEKIYKLRRENVKVLKEGIKAIKGIKSLIVNCENSTLYYPVCVNDKRGDIQRKMAEHSIYMPVIWPVPKDAEGICEVADCVGQSMLAIPCDHRYNLNDIKKIIEVLRTCLQ